MAKVSVDDFVSALKEWTVVDVMNAIKAIENEFGVTAAAPVAAAAAPAAGGGAAAAAPEAEQTEFQVVLTSPGDAKIGVIKVVREITGLGLKEAKDLVDQAPKPVKQGANREAAEGRGVSRLCLRRPLYRRAGGIAGADPRTPYLPLRAIPGQRPPRAVRHTRPPA